jgi:sortase A
VISAVAMLGGLVVLLFVGWTLWGTSLTAARAQDDLESRFAEAEAEAAAPVGTGSAEVGGEEAVEQVSDIPPAERANRAPLPPYPDEGGLVARIEIPSIDVNWLVSEGVSLDILRNGPGHFGGTPRPGEEGNSIIAGHRTTYGAPFNRLDDLGAGDEIVVTYLTGRQFTYTYRETKIVDPSDTSVLQDEGDNRLTLTACHPEYSAAERIVVIAALDEGQQAEPISDAARETRPEAASLESLDGGGDDGDHLPAYLWGAAAVATMAAVGVLAARWRRLPALLVGIPLSLLVLAVAFENVARRLPTAF